MQNIEKHQDGGWSINELSVFSGDHRSQGPTSKFAEPYFYLLHSSPIGRMSFTWNMDNDTGDRLRAMADDADRYWADYINYLHGEALIDNNHFEDWHNRVA